MTTTPAYTIEQRDGYFLLTHTKTGNTAEVYQKENCWYARNLNIKNPTQAHRAAAIAHRFVNWWVNTQVKKTVTMDNKKITIKFANKAETENIINEHVTGLSLDQMVCGVCNGENWIETDYLTKPCPACGGKQDSRYNTQVNSKK